VLSWPTWNLDGVFEKTCDLVVGRPWRKNDDQIGVNVWADLTLLLGSIASATTERKHKNRQASKRFAHERR